MQGRHTGTCLVKGESWSNRNRHFTSVVNVASFIYKYISWTLYCPCLPPSFRHFDGDGERDPEGGGEERIEGTPVFSQELVTNSPFLVYLFGCLAGPSSDPPCPNPSFPCTHVRVARSSRVPFPTNTPVPLGPSLTRPGLRKGTRPGSWKSPRGTLTRMKETVETRVPLRRF